MAINMGIGTRTNQRHKTYRTFESDYLKPIIVHSKILNLEKKEIILNFKETHFRKFVQDIQKSQYNNFKLKLFRDHGYSSCHEELECWIIDVQQFTFSFENLICKSPGLFDLKINYNDLYLNPPSVISIAQNKLSSFRKIFSSFND